jgi:hypothetical protein
MRIARAHLNLLLALGGALVAGAAMAGEDILECRLPTGQTLVLRSRFKIHIAPVISRHNSREYDRQPWRIQYFDAAGKEASTGALRDANLRYFGNAAWALQFSSLNASMVLGPSLLLDNERRWQGWAAFQSKSNALMNGSRIRADIESGSLGQAGFAMLGRVRWASLGDKLVQEATLHRSNLSPVETNTIAAVLQSTSEDDGKSWTPPSITQESLLFEVGRTLLSSCRSAQPSVFNGRAQTIDRPIGCSQLPR